MIHKTIILYDLQKKSNGERARILQKLYGYRDTSNYNYSYVRKGLLENIQYKKFKKIALEIKNKKDLSKVTEVLKSLKVDFEIAET